MSRTRIKICGLTRPEDVKAAIHAGADALGFVFYPPSPRYVTPAHAASLLAHVPPFITTVGLFVNCSKQEVVDIVSQAPVSQLQFHGDETVADCVSAASAVRRNFLRAYRVRPDTTAVDLLQCADTYRAASTWFSSLLLDTWVDAYGGAGKVFDWSLIPKKLAPQVVLSGGLSVQNVAGAVAQVRPFALDVSSGVELSKGIKDAVRMRELIAQVRQADILARQLDAETA